jgi:hypothetical protein
MSTVHDFSGWEGRQKRYKSGDLPYTELTVLSRYEAIGQV